MPYVGPAVSATVDLKSEAPMVSLSFYNASSKPVAFWVTGVTPKKVGFELDGNTNWSTVLPMDPNARIIEIRRDDLMGETLDYAEVVG